MPAPIRLLLHPLLHFAVALLCTVPISAQWKDSVDVLFRYRPSGSPSLVHLPGEFNNWANNSNGTISPHSRWTMTKESDGTWSKILRLKIAGGAEAGGGYQYKFNENGSSGGWVADPWNPLTFGSYGNSLVIISKPTVFQITPISGSVVTSATPTIIAGIFPALGSGIDTALSRILVDGTPVLSFGSAYDATRGLLTALLPPLTDGVRTITVEAVDTEGARRRDSVRLTISGNLLQWRTRSHPGTEDTLRLLRGFLMDSTITDVVVFDGRSQRTPAPLSATEFELRVPLVPGNNTFVLQGKKGTQSLESSPLTIIRLVDSLPHPVIMLGSADPLTLNAYASSHPQGRPLSWTWRSDDARNPFPLGLQSSDVSITLPAGLPEGEYFLSLTATDDLGHTGVHRVLLTIRPGAPALLGTERTNPRWIRDAVVYEIFVPAFSPEGTLDGITARLPSLRDLGVNTLWLMPIFDNNGTVNEFNGGYDIVDFMTVEPSLGTRADFRRLMDSCHASGIRLILDITPNHVSDRHPWVEDIRQWGAYSIFRPGIETRILGNDRGLGQSLVSFQGSPLYARYSNWGLANLNLTDADTRRRMMEVFRFWIDSMKVDGYRMDVYWGPHNRYGATTWWGPFREAIKRLRPDVFILGETDGTGPGSEANYADAGGACDAAYDWNLFGQFKSTLSGGDVAALHARISNYSPTAQYNHYTGPNSHYLRFLENHDETRIAQVHASYIARTMPAATVLLTTPGIPMLYAGQEVGWQGQRNKISFASPPARELLPFYRTLIRLRRDLPALRSSRIVSVPTSSPRVYGFLRPDSAHPVLVLASFSSLSESVTLSIRESDLELRIPLDPARPLYFNECLHDSLSRAIDPSALSHITESLAPWESRVFVLTDSAWFALTSASSPTSLPQSPRIVSIYPHPWNPAFGAATLRVDLPGSLRGTITLELVDGVGRVTALPLPDGGDAGVHLLSLPSALARTSGYHALRMRWTDATGQSRYEQRALLIMK